MFDKSYIYDIYTAREDFVEIQKRIDWSINPELTNVDNIDDLWTLMSDKIWGKYLKTLDNINDELDKFDDNTIVIFFSAGNLDYLIRSNLDLKF
jgi:UDP-N-acetylmuramate-alanine ligase